MAGRGEMKKGQWNIEEDKKLIAYIRRYGIWNWNHMAKPAGLARSGKSCRLRWMNYLQPNIRHGNFTKEEEKIIIKWQKDLGNRWSLIASKLQGRTDNEVKNYWNTRLKKRFAPTGTLMQEGPTYCDPRESMSSVSESKSESIESMNSTLKNFWIKEEPESSLGDSNSKMLVDSELRGLWGELFPPALGDVSSIAEDDFEAMFMVSNSCSDRFIPSYCLPESLGFEQYFISDNLWEN